MLHPALPLPCYAPPTTSLLLLRVPQVSLVEVTGPVPMAGMPDLHICSGLLHAATDIQLSACPTSSPLHVCPVLPCPALPCADPAPPCKSLPCLGLTCPSLPSSHCTCVTGHDQYHDYAGDYLRHCCRSCSANTSYNKGHCNTT